MVCDMAKVSFTTKDGKKISFSTKVKSVAKKAAKHAVKKAVKSVVSKAKAKLKSKGRSTKSNPMAGKTKKSSGGGKKGFASKIPLINNPTFRKAALAAGTVSLAATGLSLVGQGRIAQNPLLRLLLAFGVGGAVGAVTQIVPLLQSGGLSGLLGGIGGGNGANGGQGMA